MFVIHRCTYINVIQKRNIQTFQIHLAKIYPIGSLAFVLQKYNKKKAEHTLCIQFNL